MNGSLVSIVSEMALFIIGRLEAGVQVGHHFRALTALTEDLDLVSSCSYLYVTPALSSSTQAHQPRGVTLPTVSWASPH